MNKYLAPLTLLVTLTFVVSPLLTDPFTGFRADQLPFPQIDPPAQPAGYAFAIWGLIYLWLIISALFGVWQRRDDPEWNRMRAPLALSLALGTPWLWVANQSAIWATLLIFAMAFPAILATWRSPQHDRLLAHAPVAIYAGWLTAASFVSLASTAAGYGLLTDQMGWAYLAITGATLLALATLARLARPLEYAATIAWALIAIIVANLGSGLGIILAASAAILIVAAFSALRLLRG